MGIVNQTLNRLWKNYTEINQQAGAIHRALDVRGEKIENDHIAFRTFDAPQINIDSMARFFLSLGYEEKGVYDFPIKKLRAKHYEHPDLHQPKIFISELKLRQFSKSLQNILQGLIHQIPKQLPQQEDFLLAGVAWNPISWCTYLDLQKESEYASWMAAFGFRVNHFTVFFNSLKTFDSLGILNTFLKKNNFALNNSGGEIKGSKEEYLEQSSTLAYPVEVPFSDGKKTVPGCYYEFAKRYFLPNGKLFQGFVAASADKIFESTDAAFLE
jgi:hypothetical protein